MLSLIPETSCPVQREDILTRTILFLEYLPIRYTFYTISWTGSIDPVKTASNVDVSHEKFRIIIRVNIQATSEYETDR